MICLSEQRKLAVSKYVIRSLAVINSVTEEILKIQIKTTPKELKTCHLFSIIRIYINDLISECNIDIKSITVLPTSPQTPNLILIILIWKKESTNILTTGVRENLFNNYQNHIKIFADGSILDSLDNGSGFVIHERKVQKSFYLGKVFFPYSHRSYMQL